MDYQSIIITTLSKEILSLQKQLIDMKELLKKSHESYYQLSLENFSENEINHITEMIKYQKS